MSDIAIRCEGLSKQYRLGERESYKALRDVITDAVASPFRRLGSTFGNGNGSGSSESALPSALSSLPRTIWALDDVSFEVKRGEVVGIIGRNGAGKSTLLKILSRITRPTKGHARIHGRVGSLLEVGTGFHPELTGRENIFLNGAILGMRKAEIERKFDEIVAFAEVEKFVDTPVKRYSSGMYVRLAFAVAAHLEPDILIIDEVLAVGDAQFQKKCLGKIGNFAKSGRTVIFVTHQLNQIRRLCTKSLWLDDGHVRKQGATIQVLSAYEEAMAAPPLRQQNREDLGGRFVSWEILEPLQEQPNILFTAGPTKVRFRVNLNRTVQHGHHGIVLYNDRNQIMWSTALDNLKLDAGIRELIYDFPSLPLCPGNYHWLVSIYEDGKALDEWFCMPEMIVASEPRMHPTEHLQGILNLPWDFHVA